MPIWEKVKGFANDAASTIGSAAKDVSTNAKEMSEKNKLKKAIKAEEQKIDDAYKIIGENIFQSNSIAPSGCEQQYADINAANLEKQRLQAELDKLEAGTKCVHCGAKISKGQKFCPSCGGNLEAEVL